MAALAAALDGVALLSPQAAWEAYSETVLSWLVNVAAAAAILIVGFWFANKVRKFVRHRVDKGGRVDRTFGAFLANLIYYALVTFVLIAVLNRFGVQTTSLVAVLGAATLAIGLALQGTLSNVAAGVMLVLFRPYRIGDYVEVGGLAGTVKEVGLFSTELTTLDRVKVVVPNGLCWAQPIHNFTQEPTRRCDITFNIAYDADVDRALAAIAAVVRADSRFLKAPEEPWIRMTGTGANSIELQLRAFVNNADYWDARFATIKAVKDAFDEADIGFPLLHQISIQKHADERTLSHQK